MKLEIPFFKQSTDSDCGPASVRMVLAYYGESVSEEDLRRELDTNPETGSHNDDLVRALTARGYSVVSDEHGTLEEVAQYLSDGVPVIVGYHLPIEEEGHYAVVTEVTPTNVVLNDPWHGPGFTLDREDFISRWYSEHTPYIKWYLATHRNNG